MLIFDSKFWLDHCELDSLVYIFAKIKYKPSENVHRVSLVLFPRAFTSHFDEISFVRMVFAFILGSMTEAWRQPVTQELNKNPDYSLTQNALVCFCCRVNELMAGNENVNQNDRKRERESGEAKERETEQCMEHNMGYVLFVTWIVMLCAHAKSDENPTMFYAHKVPHT